MRLDVLAAGLLVLAVAFGAAFLLLQGGVAIDEGQADRPGVGAREDPPSLRGAHELEPAAAPPAAAPSPVTSTAVRQGRVTDVGGRPVEGARLVLVKKGASDPRALLERTAPIAVTDADGRWRVEGASARGSWLCAHADDTFLPAALDGDALPSGGADLRLARVASLRVSTRVVEGEMEDDPELWIRCRERGAMQAAGSPFALDATHRVEADGVTSVSSSAEAVLDVQFEALDWYADPPSIRVDGLPAAIHFDLYPMCSLDVHVTSAEDGRPLRLNLGLAVGDPATPVGSEGWIMTGIWPDQDGVVAHPLGLRPGTYAVHVKASGYRDALEEVTFEKAGEHRTVEVGLERAPEVGVLRLELSHDEDMAVGTAFVIAMRPASGGPWRSKPEAARTGLRPGVTRVDVEALVEGVYDVMVWMRPLQRVGYALSVAVHGGVDTTAAIRLDEGHLVELTKGREGPRFVRLEAPPLGRLPLIHFWGTSYSVTDERVEASAPDLGPYPFQNVERQVSPRPLR